MEAHALNYAAGFLPGFGGAPPFLGTSGAFLPAGVGPEGVPMTPPQGEPHGEPQAEPQADPQREPQRLPQRDPQRDPHREVQQRG